MAKLPHHLKALSAYLQKWCSHSFSAGAYSTAGEIIAADIYNRFYHFGVQNHLTTTLGGLSIALVDAARKSLGRAGPMIC